MPTNFIRLNSHKKYDNIKLKNNTQPTKCYGKSNNEM